MASYTLSTCSEIEKYSIISFIGKILMKSAESSRCRSFKLSFNATICRSSELGVDAVCFKREVFGYRYGRFGDFSVIQALPISRERFSRSMLLFALLAISDCTHAVSAIFLVELEVEIFYFQFSLQSDVRFEFIAPVSL